MTIRAVKTGWQVNIQPGGRGAKRLKKTFPTKAEAIAWERHIRAKVQTTPEWTPPKKDTRKLSELCDAWYKHHGTGLRAGMDTYRRLLAMCEAMENPRAETFTAGMFADYRATRLDAGISANNMNREQAYLRAVFNELIRLGEWKRENPLKLLRAFKIQERELKFLSQEEISTLLDALKQGRNKHALMIAKVCLATGARWDEAETLRKSQIRNGQVQFVRTKSSKTRVVPIAANLEAELLSHHIERGNGERLFDSAYSAFGEAVERAQLELPDGQLTHVLRHTFASYFMMNGGNILALQKLLGHQSLTMTMRYAHLSQNHLAEARQLNPLASLNLG